MSVHDLLADGRLAEALAVQEAAAAAVTGEPAGWRLLVDLLAFAGRLDEARRHLDQIRSDAPAWPHSRQVLAGLFRAGKQRAAGQSARIIPEPAPLHATHRLHAMRFLHAGEPDGAIECIDGADTAAPLLRGFLDGQEFEGLHDSDERFASVLEAFRDGDYVWFAWESIRKLTLAPAEVLLDQLYRPATVTLKDGTAIAVHVPLVYPDSSAADGAFALGLETDHICPDGGPTRCIGAKLLIVGDDAEVPLAGCRMIEIR